MYDFSIDYKSIDKFDVLSSQYLITMSCIKQCSILLNKCLLYYWILVGF